MASELKTTAPSPGVAADAADTGMVEATTTAEQRPNLKFTVGRTAEILQRDYLTGGNTAAANARGTLAELRKAGALRLEEHPLALESVLMALVVPLSEREQGKSDHASPSERAAFYALTLFGQHMQSAQHPMHNPEQSFAAACGRLRTTLESKSIKPRFDAMQSAFNEDTRMIHLRNLVALLRGNKIGFDYGQFAQDLRSLQNPRRRNGVLLRWGRDFANGTFRAAVPLPKSPNNH